MKDDLYGMSERQIWERLGWLEATVARYPDEWAAYCEAYRAARDAELEYYAGLEAPSL